MRIGIIGAGAMGGLFGGYLHASGEDVCLFDVREDHVRTINDRGLRIERPDRDDVVVHPQATTDPESAGEVDAAFVFVKAIHTEDAVRDAAPMIGEKTILVTLQNGLGNMDMIGRHVPEERVLGGVTTMGSTTEGPGRILHTGWGETKLGGDDDGAARRIAATLTEAGIETTTVDDPRPYIWDKQFASVGIKPVAALTRLRDGPLSEYGETANVMEELVREAVEVARAKDIEIIADDPVAGVHEVCRINYDTKSSMLEDVELERPTEIDHINGAILRYAKEHGIDTPNNRMATALVKGLQHGYLD